MAAKSQKKELVFTKENIVNSNKFKRYRDLLSVLLTEQDMYAEKDVEAMIEAYLKKELI